MTATTVNGRLVNPVSSLPTGGQVQIVLVDYDDAPAVGFDLDDDSEIVSSVTVVPSASGSWAAQLVPNGSIQLTDGQRHTAYRVTESGASASSTYWIVVGSTSPAWVGNLLTTLVGSSGGSAENMAVLGNLIVGGTLTVGSVVTPGSKWYRGSGVPSNGLGADGDFYLRDNGDVYFKAASSWGSPVTSILGPQGSAGAAGPAGSAGPAGAPGVVQSVNGHSSATVTLSASDVAAVPIAGGTMTGPLVLNADPTVPLGAATKQYADAAGAVDSVNGHVGVVVLGASDVSALAVANNLSDVQNAATARTSLGLGNSATRAVGTTAGTVAAGDDSRITGAIQPTNAASTVVAETGYGQSSAVGVDTTYAREDHTHGSPSLTASAPTASAVGDSAAVGTGITPARSDHTHGREAFAAPAAATSYGLSAVTGIAATLAHSDHTHGTPALTTSAPATTLAIGTAAALGSAVLPALADHVHPVAAAATPTTSAPGDAAATGNATTFAASNHVHGREAAGVLPTSAPSVTGSQLGLYSNSEVLTVVDAAGNSSVVTPPNGGAAISDLLGWTYENANATATLGPFTTGEILLGRIDMSARRTVSTVVINTLSTATLTSNQCFAGIYDSGGTRVAVTGNISGIGASAGVKRNALTGSVALEPGSYYVALLLNGSPMPSISGISSQAINFGQAAAPFRSMFVAPTSSSLPSSLTLGSLSGAINPIWFGLA